MSTIEYWDPYTATPQRVHFAGANPNAMSEWDPYTANSRNIHFGGHLPSKNRPILHLDLVEHEKYYVIHAG